MFGWFRRKGSNASSSVGDELAIRTRRLLEDLHTLEINTIQNDAMTARQMPPLPTAIAEIAERYADWMTRTLHEEPDPDYDRRNRQAQFKRLRDAAGKIVHSGHLTAEERVIAQRVYRNSITLKTMCKVASQASANHQRLFNGYTLEDLYGTPAAEQEAAWQPPLETRAEVRKIWEVGTELVLMQSMIQLEGDVITRFSPTVADPNNRQILDIHQQAIKTSTAVWSALITAVGALAETLTGSSRKGS